MPEVFHSLITPQPLTAHRRLLLPVQQLALVTYGSQQSCLLQRSGPLGRAALRRNLFAIRSGLEEVRRASRRV